MIQFKTHKKNKFKFNCYKEKDLNLPSDFLNQAKKRVKNIKFSNL